MGESALRVFRRLSGWKPEYLNGVMERGSTTSNCDEIEE